MSYRTTRAFHRRDDSAASLASRLEQKMYELAVSEWNNAELRSELAATREAHDGISRQSIDDIAELHARLAKAREALESAADELDSYAESYGTNSDSVESVRAVLAKIDTVVPPGSGYSNLPDPEEAFFAAAETATKGE